MVTLADREFETPSDDQTPLTGTNLDSLYAELDQDVWSIVDEHHLEGVYEFEDFRTALDFTVEVGELAEDLWHHPDIHLAWGEVRIELFTHSIDGLYENDFVVAARMDRLYTGFA